MSDASQHPTPNTQHPLRFGVIGCGALGLVHAERLTALPNVSVAAVSDPDAGAMNRVAEAVPGEGRGGQPEAARYADWLDLLKHDGLDAVSINSPNRWHVEQILACLDAGLHVLCEKPLSMIPEEVDQVVRAAERSGRVVSVAYQSRYRRDSRLLRRALASGRWGRVTSVSVFAGEDWVTPNAGTWRHDPERCPGGYFADANGHQLDVLFWMTGLEPARVRANMETRGTPVPIVTWGDAVLSEQGKGRPSPLTPHAFVPLSFLFAGDSRAWHEEIRIQTEGADFVMRDTRLLWTEGKVPLAPFPAETLGGEVENDTPDTAFVAALRGGEPVASPPETVWPVLRFTLAALRSAGRGGSYEEA